MENELQLDTPKMVEELIFAKIPKFDSGLNIKVPFTFKKKFSILKFALHY